VKLFYENVTHFVRFESLAAMAISKRLRVDDRETEAPFNKWKYRPDMPLGLSISFYKEHRCIVLQARKTNWTVKMKPLCVLLTLFCTCLHLPAKLPLAIANKVVLGSESHGSHNHILLSDIYRRTASVV
jgi:hypothetical protein